MPGASPSATRWWTPWRATRPTSGARSSAARCSPPPTSSESPASPKGTSSRGSSRCTSSSSCARSPRGGVGTARGAGDPQREGRMSAPRAVIVIGAGVNGLVAAACLAKAGRKVQILDGSEAPGGQSRLLEFAPGFRADPLGRDAGWLPPPVARELGLTGLERVIPRATVAVPTGDRKWLVLSSDAVSAAQAIRPWSAADAGKWAAFCARIAALSGFLEALYTLPAPDIDASAPGELLSLLGVARKLRGLGRADMIELLRTVPMSVAELLDDWFELDPLKAAIGASGVTEIRQGPRSGGTAFVLLHHHVGAAPGALRGRGYWRAGPNALARAAETAARGLGVEIRTGADAARGLVKDDRGTGEIGEA